MWCACFRTLLILLAWDREPRYWQREGDGCLKCTMPPKAKGKKGGARKMPPPLPQGEVLTDGVRKQQWVIGASIGTGGFGEIYTATLNGQDLARAEHVIKIVSLR